MLVAMMVVPSGSLFAGRILLAFRYLSNPAAIVVSSEDFLFGYLFGRVLGGPFGLLLGDHVVVPRVVDVPVDVSVVVELEVPTLKIIDDCPDDSDVPIYGPQSLRIGQVVLVERLAQRFLLLRQPHVEDLNLLEAFLCAYGYRGYLSCAGASTHRLLGPSLFAVQRRLLGRG